MPSAAANLARLTHAPDITLIYESGTLGTKPNVLPLSIGDGELCETALTTVAVPEMFRYWLQGGRIAVGFLGGAQIDQFGNLNTTVVGDYDKPKVRLPGGGGAPEIATSRRRDLHHHGAEARSFVPKLDFVTSLGHGEGGTIRGRRSARPTKPTRLMTDLAVFEPEPGSNEMIVTSIHPGVTREQIAENTGWPVRYAAKVAETPAPTDKSLSTLARSAGAHKTRATAISHDAAMSSAGSPSIAWPRVARASQRIGHRLPQRSPLNPLVASIHRDFRKPTSSRARTSRWNTAGPKRYDRLPALAKELVDLRVRAVIGFGATRRALRRRRRRPPFRSSFLPRRTRLRWDW